MHSRPERGKCILVLGRQDETGIWAGLKRGKQHQHATAPGGMGVEERLLLSLAPLAAVGDSGGDIFGRQADADDVGGATVRAQDDAVLPRDRRQGVAILVAAHLAFDPSPRNRRGGSQTLSDR